MGGVILNALNSGSSGSGRLLNRPCVSISMPLALYLRVYHISKCSESHEFVFDSIVWKVPIWNNRLEICLSNRLVTQETHLASKTIAFCVNLNMMSTLIGRSSR